LQAMVTRRRQLWLGMLASENNRLATAAKRIKTHIRWLEKELSRTERDLEAAIENRGPSWARTRRSCGACPGWARS
jgi:transposase